jgi:hypothetical protein
MPTALSLKFCTFLLQCLIDTVDKGDSFPCGNIDETNGFWGHRQNGLKSLPISIAFFFFRSQFVHEACW